MRTKTILICDDDAGTRELMRVVLDGGYAFGEAADGVEALDLVRELRPDLVILDVMLPRRSGLDVLTELRRDPDSRDTPVIVVTAWHDSGPAVLAAGADRLLLKPFEPGELEAAVKELLPCA